MFPSREMRDDHEAKCSLFQTEPKKGIVSDFCLSNAKIIESNGYPEKIEDLSSKFKLGQFPLSGEVLMPSTSSSGLPSNPVQASANASSSALRLAGSYPSTSSSEGKDFVHLSIQVDLGKKEIKNYLIIFHPNYIKKQLSTTMIENTKRMKIDEKSWLARNTCSLYTEFLVMEMDRIKVLPDNNQQVADFTTQSDFIIYSDIAKSVANEVLIIINKNTMFIGKHISHPSHYAILVVPYALLFESSVRMNSLSIVSPATQCSYWIQSLFSKRLGEQIKAESLSNKADLFVLNEEKTIKTDHNKKVKESKLRHMKAMGENIERLTDEVAVKRIENENLSELIAQKKNEKIKAEREKNQNIELYNRLLQQQNFEENMKRYEDRIAEIRKAIELEKRNRDKYITSLSSIINEELESHQKSARNNAMANDTKMESDLIKISELDKEKDITTKKINKLKETYKKTKEEDKNVLKKINKKVTYLTFLEGVLCSEQGSMSPAEPSGKQSCLLCFSGVQDILILDCGHLSIFCSKCHISTKQRHCKYCAKPVRKILKINFVVPKID